MRRRDFIWLASGAAAWPITVQAEQAKKPTIGFLGAATPEAWSAWRAAFAGRLSELGWIEGSTVAIEYRWAEGHTERYRDIAAEFVRLGVGVIVTVGSAALIAKQVTSVVPIVFAVAPDPIGSGLVASLSRPGGNVTGVSNQAADLVGKRLEILREVLPGLHELVVVVNAGNPTSMVEARDVQAAARALSLEVTAIEITRTEDLKPDTLSPVTAAASTALYAVSDPVILANRARINALADAARIPSIYAAREYVEAGGLMSYGPNYASLFARAGDFVDKILRGAKVGDLPVEQPTKFELIINLKAAEMLGLQISPVLLARASEVIE
jgi:putative ABC transport system substrate-binding protein